MAQVERAMIWRLSDPEMGVFERAGLAALYMSLRAAEEQSVSLHPLYCSSGDLTEESVTLRWKGKDENAFKKLFAWSWQIRDGVFYLPGVHRERKQRDYTFQRVLTHSGILGTFLQHKRIQPRAKGKDAKTLVEEIVEGMQLSVRFLPIGRKDGIKPLKDLRLLFHKGSFSPKPVSLSGWVMPGIAPRYGSERAQKAWNGSAKRAVLLMLAPIACMYLRLRGRGVKSKGVGTNWIFVVPEVSNLQDFDKDRPALVLSPDAVDVASLGDAALRFAARWSTRPLGERRCFAVIMGQVPFYNPGQSVRKGILEVKPTEISTRRYTHLMRVLPNLLILPKPTDSTGGDTVSEEAGIESSDNGEEGRSKDPSLHRSGFYKIPSGKGRIADNLILGRPWYADLCIPLDWDLDAIEEQRGRMNANISHERLWFRNLFTQKRRLLELMQEKEMWDSAQEQHFVQAFWEALASLYAQEAKAVERGGSRRVEERFEDLREDIRRALMRAKTRDLLRSYLAEFFAKGGRQSALVQNREAIWSLLNHPYDWKKARDLALVSLVTYTSKEKREQDHPSSSSHAGTEGALS